MDPTLQKSLVKELEKELEVQYEPTRAKEEHYVRSRFPALKCHAEDIFSDAIVLTLQRLDRLDGVKALGPWIHKVVHIKAIMKLRQLHATKAVQPSELQEDDHCALEFIDFLCWKAGLNTTTDGSTILMSQESEATIMSIIDALPEAPGRPYRRIVQLLLDGMNPTEIANILKRSVGNVYRWIGELRGLIQKALRKADEPLPTFPNASDV